MLVLTLALVASAASIWAVSHFENDLEVRVQVVLDDAGIEAGVEVAGREVIVHLDDAAQVLPPAVHAAIDDLRGVREVRLISGHAEGTGRAG
ncbi:MAG: hypothetical protein ACE5GC_06960 [Acidimicrobiia bacterium]